MNFTAAQTQAIQARGNALVIAGAGTGKTRTLVERCARLLLDETKPVSLDEILMLTFTEAAAAEMRQRIRLRLEEGLTRQPDNTRLNEQLALLDTARISTLHSFCLQLVREHFYELELDPQLAVLDEPQARLLASETLDDILRGHYAGSTPESGAVRRLIQEQARGWDVPIRELVLQLHKHTQTRPDPEGWFRRELTRLEQTEPTHWRQWLREGVQAWRDLSLPLLHAREPANDNAARCARILEKLDAGAGREQTANALDAILLAGKTWPSRKKGVLRKPLEGFFQDAAFLHSLLRAGAGDPLVEDWDWVRLPMATLVRLAREFGERFSAIKRESGAVDFHDLEQHTLRLLWDAKADRPTALAAEWRRRLKLVFVDEYQDINAAQDRILTALSRDGAEANRFLVGDVKQSIYRFRQAAPHIFQNYAGQWRRDSTRGQSIFLSDNFRSQESLLNFINLLFGGLMRREMGGVEYDEDARLKFGDAEGRAERSAARNPGPSVEVHLRLKEKSEVDADAQDDDRWTELSDTEVEARLIGRRLREMRASLYRVWDDELREWRGVDWRDMVVLLRSPRFKVESYAKEFARLDIPLQARRSGFFDSIEVLDLLNLLKLLDNPLQDAPLLAVLRSPLGGFSLDELARIRLAARKAPFWTALLRFREAGNGKASPRAATLHPRENALVRVDEFLNRFARWRSLSRQASLAQRLDLILAETNYLDWLLTQSRGKQSQANVRQLISVARRFDESHGRGLYRFLEFIEAQREEAGDIEPAPLETENAVRLMSIHQSKGLEFPVVVVADLGKRFNSSDARSGIILDEVYGLCPQVKPPGADGHYPSLPYWLARQRQKAEALGEELRILYVAFTRAQDALILAGTCTAKAARETWPGKAATASGVPDLLKANSYLDWLGPWLKRTAKSPGWTEQAAGGNDLWRSRIYTDDGEPQITVDGQEREDELKSEPLTPEELSRLLGRLQWRYPHPAAMHESAKSSVTALRRKFADETDAEAKLAHFVAPYAFVRPARTGDLDAAGIGIAHHRFLQKVSLATAGDLNGLRSEAERLTQAGFLSGAEAVALDLKALGRFWQSELGRAIRANAPSVQRELPFTARFSSADLKAARLPVDPGLPPDEFIVVQGVIDLAVVLPGEIWLVDFKTDQIAGGDVEEKVELYSPQLKLYAMALERIYRRPVTARWLHFLGIGRSASA
ncbi:MAG TPA: UvrD-helicase domain-containing protein [Verrucomicrobiae bacterium]|nr:UvrD-helicase domain-containing protein [Verrucomicrobiae bacterium]